MKERLSFSGVSYENNAENGNDSEREQKRENLSGEEIIVRATENINKLAEAIEDEANDGEDADLDEQLRKVDEALASMAVDSVEEADEDGVRTEDEQDGIAETFETALVFGAKEADGGITPEENLINKLWENSVTSGDLSDTIDRVSEAQVLTENGESLAEKAAKIIDAASEQDPAATESSESQEAARRIADGKTLKTSFAFFDIPSMQRSWNVDGEADRKLIEQALQDVRDATGNEALDVYLQKLADGEDIFAVYKEVNDSNIIQKSLLEMDFGHIVDADDPNPHHKNMLFQQKIARKMFSEDDLVSSFPAIIDSFGASGGNYDLNKDVYGRLGLDTLVKIHESTNESNRTDIGETIERRIELMVRRDDLAGILAQSAVIENVIGTEAMVKTLEERCIREFTYDQSPDCLKDLSLVSAKYGEEIAERVKTEVANAITHSLLDRSEESGYHRTPGSDRQWLMDNGAFLAKRLAFLSEVEDEDFKKIASDGSVKFRDRINDIDPDLIMDTCTGTREISGEVVPNMTIDSVATIFRIVGEDNEVGDSISLFLKMYGSASPELARYSRALTRSYYESMKNLGEADGEKRALVKEEYEKLTSFFKSNVPTYQKLAKAESIYYELNGLDSSRFNAQEFLVTFSLNIEEMSAGEISEKLEKAARTDLLISAVKSNNLQLRSYLTDAIGTKEMSQEKQDILKGVLQDFQGAFGLEELPTPEEALEIIERSRRVRDEQKRRSVIESPPGSGKYVLKKPIMARDPKKGFKTEFLDFQFQDGFNCPEALGYGAYSDATSGDADFSASNPDVIMREYSGQEISLTEQLEKSITTGDRYGRVKLVVKYDGRFKESDIARATYYITTNDDRAQYMGRPSNFLGIRNGLGAMDVDAFIVHDEKGIVNDWDRQDMKRLKFEIIKSGCYTPIVGQESGEVIFTPQEYDELRKRILGGVRAYDYSAAVGSPYDSIRKAESNSFDFSSQLNIDQGVLDSVGLGDTVFDNIVGSYEANDEETTQINNAVVTKLLEIIENSDLGDDTKNAFRRASSSLENINPFEDEPSATIFGTGSTARSTNALGDGDYDYMICLEDDLLERDGDKIIQLLVRGLQTEQTDQSDQRITGRIAHGLKTTSQELGVAGDASAIDIDISLEAQNDRIRLSTDVVLGRFYEDLMRQNPENAKRVIANVQVAKKLMKKFECYKKKGSVGSVPGYGGIGGIGVENLILQNNGSLHDAAESFVGATRAAFREMFGNENTDEAELDAMIESSYSQLRNQVENNLPLSDQTLQVFNHFRNGYMLFDRGQNFTKIDSRVNARGQHEGYMDNNYAFDDLVSGGRFEAGGWLRMYEAFKSVLDAWPAEMATPQSAAVA